MTITSVANNGRVYQLPPTLNIRVNSPLPQGAVLQVKRNGVVVGNGVQTDQLTYAFTDSSNLGTNEYTVDLVLESTTLNSAAYTIQTEEVAIPTIDTVTDSFLTPVLSGVITEAEDLVFNITVSPAFIGVGYVDMYKDDVYIGTATQTLDPTKFTYETEDVDSEDRVYTAKTRVAEFSTESEGFTVKTVSEPSITSYVMPQYSEPIPLSVECGTVLDGNMVIRIGIPASWESGAYYLANSAAPGIALDLGENVDLNHVTGVNTYYTIYTQDQPQLADPPSDFSLMLDGETVATAETPMCSAPIET